MKYLFFLLAFSLVSCDQLLKGQEQPVKQISNRGLFYTTCSGLAETMASCFDKAQKTCHGSYSIINQAQDSSGINRELTFKCNN